MLQGELKAPEFKAVLRFLMRYKVVALLIAVGLILIFLPVQSEENKTLTAMEEGELSFDVEELEKRMEKILSRIEGTGELSLLLTTTGEVENVYAVNTEYREDEESIEEQLEIMTISVGSGEEKALIKRRDYPVFQGALVVCDGGDDPAVKLLVTKAVAALTGLGTDRITVCR